MLLYSSADPFLHELTSEACGSSLHACLIRWAILAPSTGTASSWLSVFFSCWNYRGPQGQRDIQRPCSPSDNAPVKMLGRVPILSSPPDLPHQDPHPIQGTSGLALCPVFSHCISASLFKGSACFGDLQHGQMSLKLHSRERPNSRVSCHHAIFKINV